MKQTAFLLLVIGTMIGCKKTAKMCCAPIDTMYAKWELRESVGGIAGTITYQPNNGNMLEFKDGNLFTQYANFNIIQSGTYKLSTTSEENKLKITFHTDAREWSTNIILKPDTLVVLRYEPCCDIPDDTYVNITPHQL